MLAELSSLSPREREAFTQKLCGEKKINFYQVTGLIKQQNSNRAIQDLFLQKIAVEALKDYTIHEVILVKENRQFMSFSENVVTHWKTEIFNRVISHTDDDKDTTLIAENIRLESVSIDAGLEIAEAFGHALEGKPDTQEILQQDQPAQNIPIQNQTQQLSLPDEEPRYAAACQQGEQQSFELPSFQALQPSPLPAESPFNPEEPTQEPPAKKRRLRPLQPRPRPWEVSQQKFKQMPQLTTQQMEFYPTQPMYTYSPPILPLQQPLVVNQQQSKPPSLAKTHVNRKISTFATQTSAVAEPIFRSSESNKSPQAQPMQLQMKMRVSSSQSPLPQLQEIREDPIDPKWTWKPSNYSQVKATPKPLTFIHYVPKTKENLP